MKTAWKSGFLFLAAALLMGQEMPDGFVHITDSIPDAVLEIRYYGTENFLGVSVDGYKAATCILTAECASALKKVQDDLKPFGLGIKIFDGYRPQRAVSHFVHWAEDIADTTMKHEYYPDVDKRDLFRLGYIAGKSGHSRGSTVDLTIVDLRTGQELDMGSPFDYFGPVSGPFYPDHSAEARSNRALLHIVMRKHGFRYLTEEWWHFTLNNEPYPDTYFDFPVE